MFKSRVVMFFLTALVALGMSAMPASASAHSAHHRSHHHKGHHHSEVLVTGNPWLEALVHDPNVSIAGGESSSSDEVIILSEEHIGGAKVHSPRCFWGNGLNSGYTATGEKYWFWDEHMKMCPDPKSETGWVKVAGGETGADCENEVKPHAKRPPTEPPEIRWVSSFGPFHARAHASERVVLHEWCGEASASAWAYAGAFGRTKAQAKKNAQFYASGKATTKAHAKAFALLKCGTPRAPETPPNQPKEPEEPKKPPCECTPPTPPKGEVEFGNEFEFQEAHPNEEPILYWIDINAPEHDKLTVYFETETASFSPEFTQVASFTGQTKFQSYWTPPSYTGHYPVWVKVVDHTLKETFESERQWVTVIPWELEENPR